MRSLDAMLELSHYFSDETRLDRIVPFMVTLLRDEVPVVRAAAVRSLAVVASPT
jgi:phosphoinositide-3-kinase, regulatory subunit 4